MIPKNISRTHIEKAIDEVKREGIPPGRDSKKYRLLYEGEEFPPKYVVALANKYANDVELSSSEFSGGAETNSFLESLGLEIVSIATARILKRPRITPRRLSKVTPKFKHNERCPECKITVEAILRKLYGTVEVNYKFEIGAGIEDYKALSCYDDLAKIFVALQNYRGHQRLVKTQTLPRCDFFIPNPGFIVEFDESQHFTIPRKIALGLYPDNLNIGFPKGKWLHLCDQIQSRDNDPPYRDEQRAWYDTLRDFLPEINRLSRTVRLYSRDTIWCNMDPDNDGDVTKIRNLIEAKQMGTKTDFIATVIIKSDRNPRNIANDRRKEAMGMIIEKVAQETDSDGVILFPAGYYSAGEKRGNTLFEVVGSEISMELRKIKRNIVVCVGIDGRLGKDQLAVAVDKSGIIAAGRKFYPTGNEKGVIELANDYLSEESDYYRLFTLNDRRYYLAVCYDVFGIRHMGLANPKTDVILDLIHGFNPKGKLNSGDVDFARKGVAGASKQWSCPIFGSAVYFERKIPSSWPSGIFWNQGNKSVKDWKYEENPVQREKSVLQDIPEGRALLRFFNTEDFNSY